MNAIAAGSRRTLIVLSTAPLIGTPNWHSNISGVFHAMTATVSPRPTPSPVSAEASRRQRP
jgi:hypothetical protein